MPPWPITHKSVEFAIAFALVLALAWWLGRPPKPPRDGKHCR
jgi:hypothetical protein